MATASVAGSAGKAAAGPAGARDRVFYGGMALALALTVLAGFARTYYLRFLDGGPSATLTGGPFTPLVHVHAALFTGWMVLFVVQTALVASHRVAVHRKLRVLASVTTDVFANLSVAPDGRSLVYGGGVLTSDLMMIDNFR